MSTATLILTGHTGQTVTLNLKGSKPAHVTVVTRDKAKAFDLSKTTVFKPAA